MNCFNECKRDILSLQPFTDVKFQRKWRGLSQDVNLKWLIMTQEVMGNLNYLFRLDVCIILKCCYLLKERISYWRGLSRHVSLYIVSEILTHYTKLVFTAIEKLQKIVMLLFNVCWYKTYTMKWTWFSQLTDKTFALQRYIILTFSWGSSL